MAELVNIGVSGLWLNPSPLLNQPDGALKQATNTCSYRPGQLDSRRGLVQLDEPFDNDVSLSEYAGDIIAHDYTDDVLFQDGTEFEETVTRIIETLELRTQEADGRLLIAANEWCLRLMDDVLRRSGVPRALDGTADVNGDPGWLPEDSQVAYRIVWGYESEDGRVTLGVPSQPIIATNPAGSGSDQNVDIDFTIPPDIDETYFFQVYRSFPSASDEVTPDDELQLVFQRPVTSDDVDVIIHTDEATIDLMGASLYTNPSQQGFAKAAFRPPQCVDIAVFANCTFYADIRSPQRITLRLLDNITVGGIIDFPTDGVVFTAAVAENIGAKEFEVGATARETLASLERVMNRSSDFTVRAYVTEGLNLLLEAVDPTSVFTAVYDADEFPFDQVDASEFTTVTSTSQRRMNVCAVSNPRECEAVPLLQNVSFGRADKAILRILSVQDALIAFKEDGTYRLTGTTIEGFVVEEIDTTLILLGRNTARKFEHSVACMTNKGVANVMPSRVDIVSGPIHQLLLQLSVRDDFEEHSHAVAYSAENLYLLAVPTGGDPDAATEVYVWRVDTQAWTKWLTPFTGGLEFENKLVLAYPGGQLVEERKSFTSADFVDFEFEVTINSVSGVEVTLSAVPDAAIVVGMALTQNGITHDIVDIDGAVLTLAEEGAYTNAAALVVEPIEQTIEWLEQGTSNPRLLKQFVEAAVVCRDVSFDTMEMAFAGNLTATFYEVPLRPSSQGGFGSGPFGESPFGDGPGGMQPLTTWVPREAQLANWISVRIRLSQAFRSIQLLGLELKGQTMTRSARS